MEHSLERIVDDFFRRPAQNAALFSQISAACTKPNRVLPYKRYDYYPSYSDVDYETLRCVLPLLDKLRPKTQETWCFFLHILTIIIRPGEEHLLEAFLARFLAQSGRFRSSTQFLNSSDYLNKIVFQHFSKCQKHIHVWLLRHNVYRIYEYGCDTRLSIRSLLKYPEISQELFQMYDSKELLAQCVSEFYRAFNEYNYKMREFRIFFDYFEQCYQRVGALTDTAHLSHNLQHVEENLQRVLYVYVRYPTLFSADDKVWIDELILRRKLSMHELLDIKLKE
jgi:hypothetical protein